MMNKETFNPDVLALDLKAETTRITQALRDYLMSTRRRGLVVALSGGIDSSLTAALAVKAVGAGKVFGLHLPEKISAPESLELSTQLSGVLGIDSVVEDITDILTAAGCYRRYNESVQRVVPDYTDGWRSKLVLPGVAAGDALQLYSIVVQDPGGNRTSHRLPTDAFLGVVAATNFKQRVRKMLEYYHADRLNYATTGTPNRLEFDQGFFVKLGDGAADIKPIAHLYKTQVYELAEHLGVPEAIRKRPSTTDTYSLDQSQEEFYFSLPHDVMDLCLYAYNHGVPPSAVAEAVELTEHQVDRVFRDIEQKRRTTRYLHLPPALVESVPEIPSEA